MRARHLILLAVLAGCRREVERPAVIVVSIDTLRADRVAGMPNLQRFASDAITFESAWTHVPLTLPAHASLMTGLLPPEHGVRDNGGFRLDAKLPTIATMLRERGYATGAAVSAYVLRRDTGIANGFEVYDDTIPFVEGAPAGALHRNGNETIATALRWLDGRQEKPPFLFVHLFEPHTPYEPSYDADVLTADRLVGAFFDDLRTRKLYDDALIVVLSDHGEGLGDHGEDEHGILLYREALQVPLLVKLPGNARKGERVAGAVQLIDVLPAIAAVTHTTPPPNLRGRSLLEPHPPLAVYGETLYPRIHLGWSELRSVVRLPHHLIDGPKPELYDLARDPRESRNLRDTERRPYTQLREELAAMPQREATTPAISAEEAKKLAALGYLSGHAPAVSDLNPRDHLADLEERKAVNALLRHGDVAGATRRMEVLLAKHPGWSDLRDELGHAYLRMGDVTNAERTYRDALRITPELAPDFALSLAGVLVTAGKLDEAEAHARVAASHSTHAASAQLVLAQIRAARRDLAGALALLDAILPPHPPRYHFVRADILGSLGRTDEAIRSFAEELRSNPRETEAYVRMALLQRVGGDVATSQATLGRMVAVMPETRPLAERLEKEWAGIR